MLKECGLNSKGVHMISEMERTADKIGLKDSQIEGSTMIPKRYREISQTISILHPICVFCA